MADMIRTPDGKMHVAFDKNAILDLIREYVGDDVYAYLKDYIRDTELLLEEEKQELEEEKQDKELIESNYEVFVQEVKDEVEYLQELLNKPHTKKSDTIKTVNRLYDMVLDYV